MGEYVPAALYTDEKHRWEIINRHLEQGKSLKERRFYSLKKIFNEKVLLVNIFLL